jgi:hypothetical protein
MTRVVYLVGCACLLALLILSAAPARAAPPGGARASAQVYLLTGLIGITSGLDGLAAKIRQRGLPTSMASPGGWATLAESAVREHRGGRAHSIIIIGYSAGGGAALEMAAYLNAAQVPVQLLVIFDGTSGPPPAPNVRKLVNLYVPGGWGGPIARPKGFRGTLQNIPASDPNVGHFTLIDAQQRRVLGQVLGAVGAGAARAGSVSAGPAATGSIRAGSPAARPAASPAGANPRGSSAQ